jgi:predicted Zn-dependent protease
MRKVIVFLASVGALTPDRFFPLSLDSMCFERQKFASSGLKGPEHIIAAKLAPDHALGLRGYLEPISLDWYPWLLNGPNLKSVVDGNRGSDFAARLRVAAKAQGAHPEVKSLVALIDVILGSKDISGLEDAVHELPDSVVLWQRLANAQYMTRDWSGAIGSAREMMRRKTSPAHDAFAAKVFLRDPDCRQEARELAIAATASGWNFAPFFAILSEASAMLGDKEGAHEAASTAAALMPTTQHRYEQARKAMAVGAQDEATDLLLGLRDQQKLPRSAYSILIPALREANNRGVARQILAEAKVLFADKPDFLSHLEETI